MKKSLIIVALLISCATTFAEPLVTIHVPDTDISFLWYEELSPTTSLSNDTVTYEGEADSMLFSFTCFPLSANIPNEQKLKSLLDLREYYGVNKYANTESVFEDFDKKYESITFDYETMDYTLLQVRSGFYEGGELYISTTFYIRDGVLCSLNYFYFRDESRMGEISEIISSFKR